MSDGSPTPSVPNFARAREQKIEELSSHFANDDLSLDDLERRFPEPDQPRDGADAR